jgi:hypothetical protein
VQIIANQVADGEYSGPAPAILVRYIGQLGRPRFLEDFSDSPPVKVEYF